VKVQVIIAAGGVGARMKADLPKPLLLLKGVPVVIHTLRVFDNHPLVNRITLVVPETHIEDYRCVTTAAGFKKAVCIISGGETRTQSVRRGLSTLDEDTDMVIVHDAARPFVTARIIQEGIQTASETKAAVAAVPVKSTLKMVDAHTGFVGKTLERSLIWEIQTPQTFERKLLERAYAGGQDATDDAVLVEQTGSRVKVYMGEYTNIKITTPEDMDIASVFLRGKDV